MGSEPTCCDCDAPEGLTEDDSGVFACADDAACLRRCEAIELRQARAEYAALAAGLDAVTAEYERRETDEHWFREYRRVCAERDHEREQRNLRHAAWREEKARADAAERQLAAAREDGARAFAEWLESDACPYVVCDYDDTPNDDGLYEIAVAGIDAWLAAWRTAQGTEATDA